MVAKQLSAGRKSGTEMVAKQLSAGRKSGFDQTHPEAELIVQLNEKLKAVQAENQLLGRLLQDHQAGKSGPGHKQADSAHSQKAQQAAAESAKHAQELQQKLASAQQEQLRLRAHAKAQSAALDKSQAMQDDMADVLLSLKRGCEQKGQQLATATKRLAVLSNRFKQAEAQLSDQQQQIVALEKQASQQEVTLGQCRTEKDYLRMAVAQAHQQLQERTAQYDADVDAKAATFQALQGRHQALQAALAEQAVSSKALQHTLQQQLGQAQEQMQMACKERSAAVACLEALQACDEKARCSLHVGLGQIGDLRQHLVEAQQHCSQQQATVLQLHDKLLSAQKQLQDTEKELGACRLANRNHEQTLQVMSQQRSLVGALEGGAAQTSEECPTSSAGHTSMSSIRHESHEATAACMSCSTSAKEVAYMQQRLAEARRAEVGVMRALQSELCRVHVLERRCLADLTEVNTLHQQLHASQRSAWALREAVASRTMPCKQQKQP